MSLTIHSICTGDSATRGGFTYSDGNGVSPALTNSFIPLGYSVLDSDAWCTRSWFTTCITHSGTCRKFSSVCLVVLSRTRREGEKTHIGGLTLNKLKKLN